MRKLLVGVLSAGVMLLTSSAFADDNAMPKTRYDEMEVQQGKVKIELAVQVLTQLDIITDVCRIVPGPEDYASDGVPCTQPVRYGDKTVCNLVGGGGSSSTNPVPDLVVNQVGAQATFTGGFADRAECVKIQIFSNARTGAKVYVYGEQLQRGPLDIPNLNVLRLEDIYITVMREKTYICLNNLEGCFPNASTCEDPKMGACWLRLHNEAQHIMSVTTATKAKRLIVFKIGIENLNRYTAGIYQAEMTVVLMPTV